MNTELLLAIADAIAAVAVDYDIEIGHRAMVAMSAFVLESVEDRLADNALDVVITDDEPNDASQAYDAGYARGNYLGYRSPIEIYDEAVKSAKASLSGEANHDFVDGFRDGLRDAGE